MLDMLENFRSETNLPAGDRATDQTISIADLLARSIAIEWYEAVAVSQAICDKLHLEGIDTRPIHVGPEHVSIDASGGIKVSATPTRHGGSALDEVAALLTTMLGDQNIPTPLRLALSQKALIPSLEEWSNVIAYYERPNRVAVIQGLFERASNTVSRVPTESVVIPSAPASVAPLLHQRESKVAQSSRRPHRPWRYAAVGSAVVVAVLLASAVVWITRTHRSDSPSSTKMADAAPDTSPVMLSGTTSIIGTLVNQIPVLRRNESKFEPDPLPPPGSWINLPPDRRAEVYRSAVLPMTPSLPPASSSVASVDVAATSVGVSTQSFSNIIYSAADGDVVPPAAVYPQFPSIPSGTDPDDVAEFDIVVTEFGEVESVRARQAPASIADALTMTVSLSAAKTWLFRPGLKNGEPVKYRTVISILKNR